jgi:hypothetical protein
MPPAFVAFQTAITRSLTTFIEWAEQQLAEGALDAGSPTAHLHKPGARRGRGAVRAPTSVADILLETDRLSLALDAFITDPLDDSVRTDLVDLVDEVLEPILATSPEAGSGAGERARPKPRAKPTAGAATELDASAAAPLELAAGDETSPRLQDSPPTGSTPRHVPEPPPPPIADLDQPTGGVPSERPTPSPRMDGMALQPTQADVGGLEERMAQQQAAFQDRFDRLSRRINAGFFLIGVVGLGLLALNLQEMFRRPQATADALIQVAPVDPPAPPPVDEAPFAPPAPPPPLPGIDLAQIEALARQIQSSSVEIATSLATWGEGPGQVIAALSDRMSNVEDEIANLKTGMDELSAELQSQSREPVLADADVEAPSPLLADERPMVDEPDASPAPPSDLTAMRWPDAEDGAEPALDADTDRIAASGGTVPEMLPTDLDAPLMNGGDADGDGGAVTTPPDQDTGSFTAAIPAEEMILTVSAYGVQLGAMRRESGARALAEMTGLDPKTLFMQASGSWQFVILGWFAEREEARVAMDALPGTVRQLRPLIRFVEAGSRVKPVEGPVVR